ncbi:protein zwilch [Halyomorpha halys]|uniref:protein zwilch n=1 Tax=Halyomorpha halys TaxID=286706 RepID=UPI0006D4D175|nr:uncharacterized protein LOC106692523 [Halyomorpha halys]
MATDLVSVIKEVIGDSAINVSIRKVPSYVTCFVQEDRDIILIHRMSSKVKEVQKLHERYGSDISDADITGQPLEAPYSDIDNDTFGLFNTFDDVFIERNEEDDHLALPLCDARSILSHCRLNENSILPIWILTDGSDFNKTVLLSSESDGEFITRSWAWDHGCSSDITLDSLLAKHVQFSNKPLHQAICHVKCSYDVCKVLTEDSSSIQSSTTLHASWTKLSLEPPLLHRSTEIKLHTRVRIGHGRKGLLFIWRQISLLNEYIELLSRLASDNLYAVPVLNLPSSKSVLECLGNVADVSTLYSRIHKILKEPIKGFNSNNSDKKLEQVIEQYSLKDKPGTDLTDRLWLLFIECSTYQELSGCIKELFIELNKKNGPVPFLNSSNISRLGNVLQREGGIHDPLECLVEIGLEKLKKEMLLIFSKAQIAAGYNLNVPNLPNFSEVSSTDWLPFTKKWHTWLCQVHCAVEILCNVQEALALPNNGMFSIAANVLKVYTGKDSPVQSYAGIIENPIMEINTLIPVKNVEKNVTNKSPEEWVLSLNTSTDIQKFQSVFYRTLKNPFPCFENDLIDEDYDTTSTTFSRWFEFHSISEMFCA